MVVEVALVVVVNRLLEQLVAFRTLWIGALTGIDRLSFLALDDQVLGPSLQCQLLLQADTILFERLAMILCHVLSEGHSSLRTASYVAEIALAFSSFELSFHVPFAGHHNIRL